MILDQINLWSPDLYSKNIYKVRAEGWKIIWKLPLFEFTLVMYWPSHECTVHFDDVYIHKFEKFFPKVKEENVQIGQHLPK